MEKEKVPGPILTEGLGKAAVRDGEAEKSAANKGKGVSECLGGACEGGHCFPRLWAPAPCLIAGPGQESTRTATVCPSSRGPQAQLEFSAILPPHNASSQLGSRKASSTQNEWSQTNRRH